MSNNFITHSQETEIFYVKFLFKYSHFKILVFLFLEVANTPPFPSGYNIIAITISHKRLEFWA